MNAECTDLNVNLKVTMNKLIQMFMKDELTYSRIQKKWTDSNEPNVSWFDHFETLNCKNDESKFLNNSMFQNKRWMNWDHFECYERIRKLKDFA